MAPCSDSYVCFQCHNRRSVERIHNPQEAHQRIISCTLCQEEMTPIGARIEVPRQDDLKAWDRLHSHVFPCNEEEIKHHRDCAFRDGRVGCTKCKEIEKKRPEKITHNGQSRR